MSISLLLVTYNRLNLLKKAINNIEIYASEIDELIIVDNNSNDGTINFLISHFDLVKVNVDFSTEVAKSIVFKGISKKNKTNVVLVSLDENTGGSGGFHEGIKYFKECSNTDWVWGMDDDAFIQKNSLSELEKSIKNNDDSMAFWSNCNQDENFDSAYKSVNDWMFVGFCVKRKLVELIGLPVPDYFIYHDDSEYAYRIARSGYKIIKSRDSKIEHGDLKDRDYWEKNFFCKKIKFPSMSDWKLYYFIRNDIHKHSYSKVTKTRRLLKLIIEIIKLFVVKPSHFGIAIKAYYHGLIGKKGKVISP